MPNTCSTCGHWIAIANHSLRTAGGLVGECRGGPPCADFKFPRTRATDYCSKHTAAAAVNFATTAPVPSGHTQRDLFDAGIRAAAPAETSATAPSTATAARPASDPKRKKGATG